MEKHNRVEGCYSQTQGTRGGVKVAWILSERCHLFKNGGFKYDKRLGLLNMGLAYCAL